MKRSSPSFLAGSSSAAKANPRPSGRHEYVCTPAGEDVTCRASPPDIGRRKICARPSTLARKSPGLLANERELKDGAGDVGLHIEQALVAELDGVTARHGGRERHGHVDGLLGLEHNAIRACCAGVDAQKKLELKRQARALRVVWELAHRYLVALELQGLAGGTGSDLTELVLRAEHIVETRALDVADLP